MTTNRKTNGVIVPEEGHRFGPGNTAAAGRHEPNVLRRFMTADLRARLGEIVPVLTEDGHPTEETCTRGEAINRVLVAMAMAGDLEAIALVFNRAEGRAVQAIELEVDDHREETPDDGLPENLDELSEAEITRLYMERLRARGIEPRPQPRRH